jgi:hypothetical protein
VQPLFQYWKFALRGQYHPPSITKVDLVGLLEASGAEVVPESGFGDTVVRCAVLCDTESAGMFPLHRRRVGGVTCVCFRAASTRDSHIPALNYKWFLDCVSSFTVLPFTHKPKK